MNYSSLHPLAIDNVRSQIERTWDLSQKDRQQVLTNLKAVINFHNP
jgi:hypothetical protein